MKKKIEKNAKFKMLSFRLFYDDIKYFHANVQFVSIVNIKYQIPKAKTLV